MMTSFFDKIYCLNQDCRPDRWVQAVKEFARVGLTGVQRVAAIPADQPNKSFCLSQYAMLKAFLQTDAQTLITFEDDVIFKDMTHLSAAFKELPADWDVLYLGANITDMVFGIKENPPVRHSDHLYRIRKAWTTHAIGYRRPIVERIVAEYPVHTFEMYDNWLNSEILPTSKAYLVNPMVAFQRPGKSDLWGCETDYTGAFLKGNEIMGI